MVLAALLHDSLWVLAAFAVATIGFYGMKSPFWPLPSTFLTGSGAGGGTGADQFAGQLRRLPGSDRGGLCEGYDRQFSGGALRAGSGDARFDFDCARLRVVDAEGRGGGGPAGAGESVAVTLPGGCRVRPSNGLRCY